MLVDLASRKLMSLLLLTVLVGVSGCFMEVPKANAGFDLPLASRQDNAATSNMGTIIFDGVPHGLPDTVGVSVPSTHSIEYEPAAGYLFLRWESTGGVSVSQPGSQSTTISVSDSGTLTAIYGLSQPVGGVVTPANTVAVFAPYFALLGAIAAVAVVVAAAWKKHER